MTRREMGDYPQQRVRVGRATVSWGERYWGGSRIVANAPTEAIDDLVQAVLQAQQQISASALSYREGSSDRD